ncbi:MAG: Rhomboid family intrarane serine protease [Deltaproteobacteria bacterium]|nr:Rhomboid family intrarane serine protease [Deltaproteobacteria bacterium]
MNHDSQILLRVTGDQHLAEEWELVLLAQGLSPSLRRSPDGVVISVPPAEVDRALASLSAYERENPRKLAERGEPMESASLLAGVAVALMLLIFFSVTVQWLPALSWFARGSAAAERILQGEVWRTVTALTLHADVAHALSNAIAAALFLSAVSSIVGVGLGGALVLLAGAGGNLANAFLHGSPHVALGASTAVFGAVGMLGSLGMTRRRRRALSRWRAWLPVAAALALLGMLGSGGQRVDIWAHLCGLLVGAVLGIIIALVAPRAPGLGIQWACGTAAVAVLIYCWTVAFR